jgi:putative FmdB family regulatory protein
MPTYEYKCPQCEGTMSVVRSITESDPGYTCEKCNVAMGKVFHLSGIQFNGSGFYSKDK